MAAHSAPEPGLDGLMPLISCDFYLGADGPTVIIETSAPEGLGLLQSLFERLASGSVGFAVRLSDQAQVSISESLQDIEFNVVSNSPSCHFRMRDGGGFSWAGTPEEWETIGLLIQPLTQGSGHQYLTDLPSDDAIVEVSYAEQLK